MYLDDPRLRGGEDLYTNLHPEVKTMDGEMSLYYLESVYAQVLVWLLWSPIFYEDIKKPTRMKQARKECGKQEIDGPVRFLCG